MDDRRGVFLSQEVGYVCPECGADIDVNDDECKNCGTALEWENGAEEGLSEARNIISKVEELIYWAEKFDVDTIEVQEKLTRSKEELEVGDWERSAEYAQESYDILHEHMMKDLKEELKREREELKAMSREGKDISEVREVLKKAISAVKKGKLVECIERIKEYRKMTNQSV